MKIGCCVNMLAREGDPTGSQWLGCLQKDGYDYVEIPLAQSMELSDWDFQKLCDSLSRCGVSCECCNNFFPASVRLTGLQADLSKAEEYMQRAVPRAAKLGAKVIVFGSSGAKNVPEGFDKEEAFRQVVAVLKKAGEICGKYGIVIAIEPLNRKESNLILNLSEGAALMEAVSMPEVGLLVDYYHYAMEKDTLQTLQKLAPKLRHAHFAEPNGRVFPLEANTAYTTFFDVLQEAGYAGRCSIEAYSKTPEEDLAERYPGVERMPELKTNHLYVSSFQ